MIRLAAALLAASALAALACGSARADGDPASDILLNDTVFISFESPFASEEGRALEQLTRQARAQRIPIRVAIVALPSDLGSVPGLFGKADRYARFLYQELQLAYHGTLIVVMGGTPGGVAIVGPGASARSRARLGQLKIPKDPGPRELGRVAVQAVRAAAAANGHTLKATPPRAAKHGGGSGAAIAIAVAALLAIAATTAGMILLVRRGGRQA